MKIAYPSYKEIQSIDYKLAELRAEYWLHHDLFSFQWWLLLSLLIFPWVLWWKYVERNRLKEIMLFGSLLIILVGLMDDIGVNTHLWSYPYQLFQVIPRLTAINYGMLIVAHMFVYQFFKEWKSFLIANIVMATIFSFILEPITVWLGIYKLENWKYVYSFPIYIGKAVIIKWIVEKIIIKNK